MQIEHRWLLYSLVKCNWNEKWDVYQWIHVIHLLWWNSTFLQIYEISHWNIVQLLNLYSSKRFALNSPSWHMQMCFTGAKINNHQTIGFLICHFGSHPDVQLLWETIRLSCRSLHRKEKQDFYWALLYAFCKSIS